MYILTSVANIVRGTLLRFDVVSFEALPAGGLCQGFTGAVAHRHYLRTLSYMEMEQHLACPNYSCEER